MLSVLVGCTHLQMVWLDEHGLMASKHVTLPNPHSAQAISYRRAACTNKAIIQDFFGKLGAVYA